MALEFRVFLIRSLAFFLSAYASCAAATAGEAQPVEQYTLANGLTVILAPSKTAQTVSLVVKYKVGSANETPGRSGFAHLFEHLMFEGTKAIPDFDKVVSSAGGENNAFTEEDATTYYLSGPKEALPAFLRLDADRMANLANAVTQEDLDNQRAVVLNEMRQNTLDRPGGAARVAAASALFPKDHPYGHSTIGSIADLKAAKLDDVVAFHRTFYVPSNAFVAVTGSFDVAAAKAQIGQTFGLVPKLETPPVSTSYEVTAHRQRLSSVDAVPAPVVTLSWAGPKGFSRHSLAIGLAAQALAVGKTSLENRLVVQEGVASQVYAGWEERLQQGAFTVLATAAPGVDAATLESALFAALETTQKNGLTQEALETVYKEYETGYASAAANPLWFGMMLTGEAMSSGDARQWQKELVIGKTIPVSEVTAALRRFSKDTVLVSTVEPGPRKTDYPPVLANSTGFSLSTPAAARPDVVIPEFVSQTAAALVFPATETRKLASGATLVTYKIDDPANVGMTMVLKGGGVDAATGLSNLAMGVENRGAGALSYPEFDQKLRATGIRLFGGSDRYASTIFANAPLKQFDAMCSLLAEAVLRPRFDDKEWNAAIGKEVNNLAQYQKNVEYQARRSLSRALYPTGVPEAREASSAGLKALKMDDAKALFAARTRPENVTIHVASSMAPENIAAALNKAFAGWKASGAAEKYMAPSRMAIRPVELETQVQGATQASIIAILPAPEFGTLDYAAFDLAADILGGGFRSRLNQSLREEKGWSYGISADAGDDKAHSNPRLLISTTVEAAHMRSSINEIKRVVAELATRPVTEDELQAARRVKLAQFLQSFESAQDMAMFAGSWAAADFTPDDIQTYMKHIEMITLKDVNRQAAIIADSPMAISFAGDKAVMR